MAELHIYDVTLRGPGRSWGGTVAACNGEAATKLVEHIEGVTEADYDTAQALVAAEGGAAFTCPRCGAVSHNPNDAREGYCARCHDWTGRPDRDGKGMVKPDA